MRQIWVGCILLSSVVGAHAASLGRHSGAAVIGRPLDLRVQTLIAPGEDINDLCIQSEVFYGDTKVSPGAVRSTPQRSAPDAEASIRVESSIPVDEPVVTVYVRVGCNAPFSRRYVLLADPITEPLGNPSAVAVSPASGSVAPRSLPSAQTVQAAPAATTASTPPADLGPSTAMAPVVPTAPKRAASPKKTRPAATTGKAPSVVRKAPAPVAPRLELEPVDVSLGLERDPVLKLSLSMLGSPTSSEEERAAAARLWQAINSSPEDILRDNRKLEVLEAEAKGLREQEARNRAEIEGLSAQVEQTRYLSWLVYGLGGALLVSLAGWVYLWRRRSEGLTDDSAERAWWAAAAAEKELEGKESLLSRKGHAELDLDLGEAHDRDVQIDSLRSLRDSHLEADSSPASLHPERRDFAPSQLGVSRSVATEELFDVQQQADFFVSLGEHDQAIEVLKGHIAESQEPSALAYLDLLKLYHKLGREKEYNQLRKDFNHLFNASAPGFAQYSDAGRGLEHYDAALARIQALWPQPKVLDLIEKSIFREPGDVNTEVFDLEAYRELLLLHAIAKDVIKRESFESSHGADFQHTAIRPLKAASNRAVAASVVAQSEFSRETQPLDELPPASPHLGLDVDLDELVEISAFEASLPEVPVPVQPTAKPAGARSFSSDEGMSNLIDFEMPDIVPPSSNGDGKKG